MECRDRNGDNGKSDVSAAQRRRENASDVGTAPHAPWRGGGRRCRKRHTFVTRSSRGFHVARNNRGGNIDSFALYRPHARAP